MEKGLIHIYTGDGKGKTTAATGLAVRAAGGGFRVLFVQFFKAIDAPSGEKEILKKLPGVEIIRSNVRHPVFTGGREDAALRGSILETFERVKQRVARGGLDMLVLDEVMSALNGGWLELEALTMFLKERPPGLEVVLTGRNAPTELVKAADYVTEMLKIKHPFDSGVRARRGIEF